MAQATSTAENIDWGVQELSSVEPPCAQEFCQLHESCIATRSVCTMADAVQLLIDQRSTAAGFPPTAKCTSPLWDRPHHHQVHQWSPPLPVVTAARHHHGRAAVLPPVPCCGEYGSLGCYLSVCSTHWQMLYKWHRHAAVHFVNHVTELACSSNSTAFCKNWVLNLEEIGK